MIEELYRSIDDWLVDQDSDIRASEIQGLLAGLMAANATVRPDEFVARLAEYADIQPGSLAQISDSLESQIFGQGFQAVYPRIQQDALQTRQV